MRRERLQNDSSTTLNGNIDDSQTTITVNDGSVFPSEGDFRLLCESEIMLCTARSTNDLTVVRGREGTTGASHLDTTAIDLIVTEDALERYVAASVPWHNQAPALRIYDSSGAPIGESSFTWVNQGGATATDRGESIILKAPAAAGASARLKVISAPSAPFSVIGAFSTLHLGLNEAAGQPRAGILVRESSTGEFIFMGLRMVTEGTVLAGVPVIVIQRFTNATTFSAEQSRQHWHLGRGHVVWFKIEDDNTDLNFYISPNGIDWHEIYTEGRTAFMAGGADQAGFGINVSSASTVVWQSLHHFSFE